ncbi:MAG: hypothetical protein ACXVHS_10255, partial [Methanobacterium sp.]
DPNVNIKNPSLNSFTLPYISDKRPKLRSNVAVTSPYPMSIHKRYWNEVNGSILMPLKIAGSDIKTMLMFIIPINDAMSTFESAIHL